MRTIKSSRRIPAFHAEESRETDATYAGGERCRLNRARRMPCRPGAFSTTARSTSPPPSLAFSISGLRSSIGIA
jgi:hypothetical protein